MRLATGTHRCWIGRWAQTLVLVLSLATVGLVGCKSNDTLMGEKFHEDELNGVCKKMRPPEPGAEASGLSNKSQQIERELGYK